MGTQKTHIAYLGEWGFPVGYAAIQRQILVAKGLIEHGDAVTVISYKGWHHPSQTFPPVGEFEGIPYRYTSGTIYRPQGFFKRNWLKIVGRYNELMYLRRLKKQNQLDVAMISNRQISHLLLYWIWLRLHRIPMVFWVVEFASSIVSHTSTKQKINDYIIDYFTPKMADGGMAISDYLISHLRKVAPRMRILKSPIICNFKEFEVEVTRDDEVRFVYIGSPSYLQLIEFVLEAFSALDLNDLNVSLNLILGGSSESYVDQARTKIAQSPNAEKIIIHRNILREEVVDLCVKASALVIPMRHTIQDKARFPHKLGEYLASGNPVITNRWGEINNYDFIDGKTALITEDFDPAQYAEKMRFVIDHPEEARAIGLRGKEMGYQNFDYRGLTKEISEFLASFKKNV